MERHLEQATTGGEEAPSELSPFGSALIEAADERDALVVLDGGGRGDVDLAAFAARYPGRLVAGDPGDVGALVSVAAGMAASGRLPVVVAPAASLVRHAFDVVADQCVRPGRNVKLVGSRPGTAGASDPLPISTDDIAGLRTLPGLVIVDPCDPWETRQATWAMLEHPGPVYMRRPAADAPADVDPETHFFQIGRATLLHGGHDVGIVASSTMVRVALEAASALEAEGISVAVLSVGTVKPFDDYAVVHLAERTGALVTAENHSVVGGLFSCASEALARAGVGVPVVPVGVRDAWFPPTASETVEVICGMTVPGVATAVRAAFRRRGTARTAGEDLSDA